MSPKHEHRAGFIGVVALVAFVLLLVENTAFGDAHPRLFRTVNAGVWLFFIADVVFGLVTSEEKGAHLRGHWQELIVLIPLVQYIPGADSPGVFTVVRQVVIVVMLVSRLRRARSLPALLRLKPAQLMLSGFLGAIGVGAILLMLPAATASGERMPLVDAVFTATSAVCVTGLIVEDTATYFSVFGQLVIVALIQVGGLGIMTFSVVLTVFLGKQMNLGQQAALQDALDHDTLAGVRHLVRFIVLMTIAFEFAGGLLLFVSWRGRFDSTPEALYHSFFHAISAFCNAGFSTFSDSLVAFQSSPGVNATIAALIVCGGLGFMVIQDLVNGFRERVRGRRRVRVRVQTKIVLTVTALLILGGAVVVYITERGGLLDGLSPGAAALSAVFQSVTARTAGFNTLDVGSMTPATLFATIVLMFIGASPGSTGGGIKTTTVLVLWVAVIASLRNRPHGELFRRTIPNAVVYKALTVLSISSAVVALFTLALLCVEDLPFLDVLFETVSAFATVGLSMGATAALSAVGRVLVTVLMFIGRLGPLTIAYAMLPSHAAVRYTYAEERVMIG